MKKLVAAVLTGVLVAGTLSTGVYAKDDDKTITVAASATPHAEILEEAKPLLEKEGYELEVTVFDDYVRPNEVVESGEFDANYFQHIPYLDQFNEEKGTHLVNAGGIHYEPFGIYPGTKDSLDDLEDGDSIAVPNDTTNEARALLLLQDNGIITLKEGAGLSATVKDIEENPHNVEIVELEAAQVARVTGETAYVVLNGNYALEAGFSVGKDALAYEKSDSEAAKTYVNVIAVKEGNEESEKIQALVDVLKSDEIKDFINEKYDGAVIPFDDSADAADSKEETKDDAAEENYYDYYYEDDNGNRTIEMKFYSEDDSGDAVQNAKELFYSISGEPSEVLYQVEPKDQVGADGMARGIVAGTYDDEGTCVYIVAANDGQKDYIMELYYPDSAPEYDYDDVNYIIDCVYRYCSFAGGTYKPRSHELFMRDDMGEKK